MTLRSRAAALLLFATFGSAASAQRADPGLLREILAIKAIDAHAHPRSSEDATSDGSAIPDSVPAFGPPARMRPGNPEYREAWRALWGYQARGPVDTAALVALRQRVLRKKGSAYPAWVLDKLGFETMLANRITMPPGLAAPAFRWVWDVNPLLFPLDNSVAKQSNPQRRKDFEQDEAWLRDFLAELKLAALPPTLEGYLSSVVIPLLEKRKRQGAVSVKFYAAYMRSLDFADVPEADAQAIYARGLSGGQPDAAEYKRLQDFLFRRIAREAGRVGLPLQIHVGAGAGAWFYNSGASPFLLESVLNDPTLRQTTFVLVHGGLPFAAATRFLLGKPNVYADFSSQGFLTSTRELSVVLRSWLGGFPEKVLFGTDASALTTSLGWEEIGWVSARAGRRALALALTGMMEDGEIDRARASEIAHLVLRDNARRAYDLH